MRRFFLLVAMLVLPAASGGQDLRGQSNDLPTRVVARVVPPAQVPFGPGEDLVYDVKFGALGKRGEGRMTVVGVEEVRGVPSYHVYMGIQGGFLFAKVNDRYESWFDITNLVSRRFLKDVNQLKYHRFSDYDIFPDEKRFARRDADREGPIPTDQPLDEISVFYFVRSLPLEVGQHYSFDRYYRENGNPIVIDVVRLDTVEVPAGTFETIVVRPTIQTKGLFSQGGEAELHFSNDDRRLLVYMTSKIPLVGSLSLHLKSVTEGVPLRSTGPSIQSGAGGPDPPSGPGS
jgi:hypothetical protein